MRQVYCFWIRFSLLAHHCILRDKNVVRMIMSQLALPRSTGTNTDVHYRCSVRLRSRSE